MVKHSGFFLNNYQRDADSQQGSSKENSGSSYLGAGGWGNQVSPAPHPVEGFGRAQPSPEQPYVYPVGVRRSRMGPDVNISPRRGVWENRVSPRPRPREGEGAALKQGYGETGFPHIPTRWDGLGGLRPPKKYFHSR